MTDTFLQGLDPPDEVELSHTRLGIASFVLGLVGNCLIWGSGLVIAGLAVASTQGMDKEILDSSILGGGLVILFGLLCTLVGLPLGIAGMFQKERRPLYAIIGLGICALTVFGGAFFAVLGLVMTPTPA